MSRLWLKALGGTVATVAAVNALCQEYDALLLPTLGFENSSGTFVAEDGAVLAYVWTFIGIPSLFHGYIYDDGSITMLQRLPLHADAVPISMNSSGKIVGYCKRGYESPPSAATWDLSGNVSPPFLWRRVLGNTSLSDINEAGEMVMNAQWFSPQYRSLHLAEGVPTYLFQSGPLNIAYEINNHGTICGKQESATDRAFLWHDGQVTLLPGNDATASGINDSGIVVGEIEQRPAYWRDGIANDLPRGRFSFGFANAVDEKGTIVGGLYEQGGPYAGALWRKGKLTILEPLFPEKWGVFNVRPAMINEKGQIAGTLQIASGHFRGFVLTPN